MRVFVKTAAAAWTQAATTALFATHFYHLYTHTIDIQPENRVIAS